MKTVAYVRVSDDSQNLDRQIEAMRSLGIEDKYIYTDKQSGKDFERIGYQYMKKALQKDDLMVISSIDRLGRNYTDIIKEWREITQDIKADISVLDMPMLDTSKNKDLIGTLISDIVLQLLSYVAEQERTNIKKRQAEGIAVAKQKGKHLGRPKAAYPANWKEVYEQWKKGTITAVKAMELTDLSKVTYYKLVKQYEGRM
jgi:DNA invertase Pin-like site-specific DNA recombinase